MAISLEKILEALTLGEDKDWEFKSAKGGLPGSMWETYSAMANTDGGTIVLGIKQNQDGSFELQGLDAPEKIESDFWSTINNRGHVSANLLANNDVRIVSIDGLSLLVVEVSRASRRQRPVYIGQNPLLGTFRRYNEGDYRCSDDEVRRMLSDQSEETTDARILPLFGLNDLDNESVQQYRNRFSARSPNHAWLNEDTMGFLRKLGGWGKNRESNEEGLTIAGLLMFGNEDALNELTVGIKYHVDYRERVSNDIGDRWDDRLTIDGTWVPNLFQFFQRVYSKMTSDLKLPFRYREQSSEQSSLFGDPVRSGMSPAHEAIQEALVNALIHADYRGQGGVVIDRFADRFELSNPGTLLVSLEQLRQGAVSECRNPYLQRMFQMMGAGDKAGSGIDKIRQGWASQKWRWPLIEERLKPERVRLILPMVSIFPEASLERLRSILGNELAGLGSEQVQALVTADVEGSVTNLRLQQFIAAHSSDITKSLQELVAKGFLVKENYGRWASYRLSDRFVLRPNRTVQQVTNSEIGSPVDSSPHSEQSLPHKAGSLPHNAPSLPLSEPNPESLMEDLARIVSQFHQGERRTPEQSRQIVLALCRGRFLTLTQIAHQLERSEKGVRDRFITKMLKEGLLESKYPEPTHPDQAYTAKNVLNAESPS